MQGMFFGMGLLEHKCVTSLVLQHKNCQGALEVLVFLLKDRQYSSRSGVCCMNFFYIYIYIFKQI